MSDLPPKSAPPAPVSPSPSTPTSSSSTSPSSTSSDAAPAFDLGPPPDEFAHIPHRPARPPVLAIGAAVLALFLAVRMRNDVSFALSSRTPIELDGRAAPGTRVELPLNRLVRIVGRPERESAVVLDARGSWTFTPFFRLRGTQGRIFVRRLADPLPVALADRDVFVGRLVAFGELSFAPSITEHFATRVSATHFFAPAALASALSSRAARVPDLGGDDVSLAPEDRLAIDVSRPDHYTFEWPSERTNSGGPTSDGAAVRALVVAAGGSVVPSTGSDATVSANVPQRLTVQLSPEARDAVMARVQGLGRGLEMRPARDTLDLGVGDLAVKEGVWHLGAGPAARTIPADQIIAIRTRAAVKIPDDAVLLIEGETPAGEVKALVILAFLAGFAAVNLVSLRRARTA